MVKKYLDINTWNRKEHFHLFKSADDPFFALTVDVDFTSIYHKSKEERGSFFLHSLHTIMQAANAIDNFRYRLEEEKIVCYDIIHPSCTIGRDDGTFGFSFFPYTDDRALFIKNAEIEIDRIKQGQGLMMNENTARQDTIHYSSLPWIRFTDLKHTVFLTAPGSVPKISTGKCQEENKRFIMPISITVHHALMDGLHVAKFLEALQDFIEKR